MITVNQSRYSVLKGYCCYIVILNFEKSPSQLGRVLEYNRPETQELFHEETMVNKGILMLEYLLNRYGLPFTAIIVVITLTLAFSTCGSAQEPATSQEPATGKESLNQYTVTEKTHDIGCIDDVLGMATTDDIIHRGRPPTGEELDKIQRCKLSVVRNTSAPTVQSLTIQTPIGSQPPTATPINKTATKTEDASSSTKPIAVSPSVNGTVTEKTHDIGCIDDVLGMDTTDDIVQEGRPPTGAELDKIQRCKLSMGGENNKPPKHETDKPAGSSQNRNVNQSSSTATSNVDEESHDIDCIRYILGTATVNEIIDGGRPATDQELNQITHCEISGIKSGYDQGDSEKENKPEYSPPSEQKNILPDWGFQPTNCEGDDKDDSGMPIGPQCNLVPIPPEPGVILGQLIGAKLPSPKYGVPSQACQSFQEESCNELQWEEVSDLMAGEFVQIRISRTNPNIMYAGTDSNDMTTYRSTDSGATWDLVHVTGHAAGLAISPIDPNIVLYTNLEAPVQLTSDGGNSWSPVVGSSPSDMNFNKPFTAISFSLTQPNIVYTAALRGSTRGGIWPPEPSDIYKSTDSGSTWVHVGTCETCSSIQTIVIDSTDSNVLWVASEGGLQQSEDGGQTWSGNVIPYLQEVAAQTWGNAMANMPKVIGLDIHPAKPDIILAATSEYGIFRSTDAGNTWSHSNSGLETSKLHQLHFSPSNPDVVYLSSHNGIYRSDDAGQSWTARNDGLEFKFLSPIAIHPEDENIVFAGTTSEIYTIHPEHKNNGMHDGQGLYKSVDGGIHWSRSDTGIVEAKTAQIGAHPILPFNTWVGGESGRGNFYSPDGGDSWLFSPSITSHYPMVYAFNYEFPTIIYTTGWLRTGELTASTDEGASWYTLTHKLENGLSARTRELGLRTEGGTDFHIHGVAVAPSDPNTVYVGSVHDTVYPNLTFNLHGAHIWKSSDGGQTFPEMSEGFPIETKTSINSIVVHPTNSEVAYAMTTLHETETAIGIYKTTNGAQSWFPVNEGLDPYTNDLQMDPINPDILYAATESGIYKTTNGAQSWSKYSTGIPKAPVIDMAIDPLNPLVLYAITAEDLYSTRDGAEHWYPSSFNIPLLQDFSKTLSAQERLLNELRLDRTKTGHSMYGGTFAQDRTLEIDATGRLIVVAVKTNRSDTVEENERKLYRAILTPLVDVEYQFSIGDHSGQALDITSKSNIYDLLFDSNTQEVKFTAAGPSGTESLTSVRIPSSLLSGGEYALECCVKVLVDGIEKPAVNTDKGITFQHVHIGRSEVIIKTQ